MQNCSTKVPLNKTQKTSLRWLPLGTWISKFWVCRTSSWPNWGREPKFQLSRSYGLGCRRGTNFAFNGNGNGAWQTEIFFSLKSCFLAIKNPLTWISAIKNFHFSRYETKTSLIFHMWQVKTCFEQKKFQNFCSETNTFPCKNKVLRFLRIKASKFQSFRNHVFKV
jgi:hypothetical protein